MIREVGICDLSHCDRVQEVLEGHAEYFRSVKATAFLDDTTTKNVIIDRGVLSGIVDVDELCFGDPLFTPALTQMSLLASQYSTDYVDYWKKFLNLDSARERAFQIYTAMFCINFMGEVGAAFNKSEVPIIDAKEVRRLENILDQVLEKC